MGNIIQINFIDFSTSFSLSFYLKQKKQESKKTSTRWPHVEHQEKEFPVAQDEEFREREFPEEEFRVKELSEEDVLPVERESYVEEERQEKFPSVEPEVKSGEEPVKRSKPLDKRKRT